jgi:hypothetical protein
MEKLKSIIGIIVIFGFINLLLWGGQELYWRKDMQEIRKIENYLASEKTEITLLESKINNQSISIDFKQKGLNSLKNNGLINEYNAGVDDYNILLQKYKSNVDIYNGKLTEYNNQVDCVNELIKKSGSRWYLIPIPIPGKSTKSKL